ncbi:MBL fold metallo-hydrolase [Aquisalibacillus elongatus]|uniref:Glyoxylase-like metal-dependent hydrolase (Beta-lactamase superfamily II) n=1 Tax=Aquisalibacillus elongatus TaxID=485577 RepID=A0A3N5AYU3_9BACI|nr:MBL fold metallo-hydrolase [Aquisalibacillus elongatus]RPF50139.1 glyoxylase-like metal-dependent hydrolase (beta-lactamase superfamily II) [Aquisalibacillus elongatus]
MVQVFEKEGVTCIEIHAPEVGRVYFYLVDGMLIDTGVQRFESDIIPILKDLSFDSVVLTHSHEDHSGLGCWIQENRDVPIYVHPKGIDICKHHCPYPKYRQMVWGIREAFTPHELPEEIQSRNYKWKVIGIPGHAEDQVAFLNQETGVLFSGDLYIRSKTKVIMDTESIPLMMQSIRDVLTYDFDSMFCGHAGYLPNGKEYLREKLANLERTYEEVKALLIKDYSMESIHSQLFPGHPSIIDFSEGEYVSKHIVRSIIEDINNNHDGH